MTTLQTSNAIEDVLQRSALNILSRVSLASSSATPTMISPGGQDGRGNPEAWDRAVNRLIEFGAADGVTDEDGVEWPSPKAISETLVWMQRLPSLPESILPDGEGGIAIERRNGQVAERIEIDKFGTAEYLRFDDCRLVERRSL